MAIVLDNGASRNRLPAPQGKWTIAVPFLVLGILALIGVLFAYRHVFLEESDDDWITCPSASCPGSTVSPDPSWGGARYKEPTAEDF